MLQRLDIDFAALQGRNAFSSRTRRRERRDGGDACSNRGAANGLLVEPWFKSSRSVDDQLNALPLDEIDDVRPSFFDFVDALHVHACTFAHVVSARRCNPLEAHAPKLS